MSQIHKAKITTQKLENEKYRIEVIYNCQIFETEITNGDFSSQFIEIDKLEDINNGNIRHDNLKFKIEYEENKEINNLNVIINTTLKLEGIKEMNEKVIINLQKKGDVDQVTKHMLGNCKGRLISNGFNSNMIITISSGYLKLYSGIWECYLNENFYFNITSLQDNDEYKQYTQDIKIDQFKDYFKNGENEFCEKHSSSDKLKTTEILKYLINFINKNHDIKTIKSFSNNLIINTQFNINRKENDIIDVIDESELLKLIRKNNRDYEILEPVKIQNRGEHYIIKYYN